MIKSIPKNGLFLNHFNIFPMNAVISLDLPEKFQQSCDKLGIRSDAAIQSFIDSISIYAFLVKPSREQCSVASCVFGYYVKCMDGKIKTIANPDKKDIGLYYIKQILQLVRYRASRKRKEEIYDGLITEWYAKLLKINQP